jgi:hypothetical protein
MAGDAGRPAQAALRNRFLVTSPTCVRTARRPPADTLARVSQPERIFHIATQADWRTALDSGRYTTSTLGRSLAEEGFIHACRRNQVETVFDRFYRADQSRSRATGGTGLGLAITKHLVEAHQGHVEVTTTPGRGSTFTISLPTFFPDAPTQTRSGPEGG